MPDIYLDNSSTTRPFPEVVELMNNIQLEIYGNPSSMHEKGLDAEKIIGEARNQVSELFSGRESEIIFTSGGTEGNNLAIKGSAFRHNRRGMHLITCMTEHPSVLNCYRYLEKTGFTVSYLPVSEQGLVSPAELEETIRKDTILVSIMHVNNEIGTIQPLEEIGRVIRRKNPEVLFHIDAVQSFARLPLRLKEWQADIAVCSAHKAHGPRGAGCIWIKEGTLLEPLLHGGGQESGMRPGTENTAAIAGFGLAARLSSDNMLQKADHTGNLKQVFCRELKKLGIDYNLNSPPGEEGAPHILNLSFPGLRAELLLHSLEERNIFVSAGSACHSRHPDPSHVLKAIGLSKERLESALRFSFSALNTEDEIFLAAQETAAAVGDLKTII